MNLKLRTVLSAMLGALLSLALVGMGTAQTVTVTMIEFVRPEEAQWQREVVRRFHESQDRIRVELVSTAGSNLVDKMLSMLASGTPLDIGYHDPPIVLDWANSGIVKNLEPYFVRDGEFAEAFFPQLFEMATIDGNRYGVPMDFQLASFFYSTDRFQEAGVAEPTEGISWDEILEMGPKFVRDLDQDGTADRWAVQFPRWLYWWTVLWGFGAEFFDDPMSPTRFTGDSPEMRAGLEFYYSAIHESGVMAPRQVNGVSAAEILSNERVAMTVDGSLRVQNFLLLQPDGGWDAAPMPVGPAGNPSVINGLTWFVFEDASHPDEAWELLKFFSSESALRVSYEMRGILVPHRDVALEWSASPGLPRNKHGILGALDQARPWPIASASGSEANAAIVAGINAVVDGAQSIPQVIENWRTSLNNWLASRM